ALHPVLILAMIPLFDQVIYPFLEKQQVLIQPVLRILFGPDSMKSVIQAAWLFTIAAGNLVMVLLVAIIGDRLSRVNEFFFALVCGVGTLLLLWGGSQFVYKQDILVLCTKLLSNSLQSNLITEAQNTKTHGDSFAQQLQIKMTC
ncbi:unnamed protein product, partial [Sphagnum jensenii]